MSNFMYRKSPKHVTGKNINLRKYESINNGKMGKKIPYSPKSLTFNFNFGDFPKLEVVSFSFRYRIVAYFKLPPKDQNQLEQARGE